MSRNGLLDLLRLSYKTIQISQQLQTSAAEAQGWMTDRLSRRRLLQGGSVIAGAIALNAAFSPVARAQSIPKVLIVGAGIAGLTAAYRLHQAGVPIDLVEASRRVGGRMSSLASVPDAPGVVELGGEFVDTQHVHIRSIAAELNLAMADLRSADRGLIPEVFYIRGEQISHRTIAEEFKPLAAQILKDLESIASDDKITYHHPSAAAVRLDRISLADYLDSASISPTLRDLIRVAYVTEMGMDIEEQSCLNLLFLIGTEIGGWSTYGISDERYHVIGGNDRIPRALADRISPSIETGTVLESIRSRGGSYQVSLRQDGVSQERTYDRILLTVPFSVLRQIDLAVEMAPVKRQAIDQLGYGTSSKLAVPFRERLWRSRYGSTASIYTDLPFQNTWESARYQSGSIAWLTDLRGGKAGIELGAGDPEIQAQLLTRQLDQIFPGLEQVDRGQSVRAFWAGEPYQQGSYSAYRVGQWTSIGGAEGERIGNIWFAGEHCSYASQGYMEGACETGEYAAFGILADLGLPTDKQADRLKQLRRSQTISRPTFDLTRL